DFDYIIAMDQSNVDDIQSINPNIKGKLFKLLDFSDMTETDVPDPYYTNNFEGVYKMVQSSCHNLIDFIIKDANLREGKQQHAKQINSRYIIRCCNRRSSNNC